MNLAWRYRIGLAAILAAAGLLFAPSLRFPFVWDDTAVIRDNPYIHSPVPAGIYFSPRYWKHLVPVSRSDYRPLQMLTLAALSRIGGRDPLCYRLANLALHLLAVALVFALARRLGAGKAASLLAAAFFAFHPVHVETIAGARNLSELMASNLLLAALVFFPRPERSGSRAAAFFLFAAALLYKENALILPPLLTILVLAGPGRSAGIRAAIFQTFPFWILALGAGVGKLLISPGPALSGPPPAHFIAGAARLMVINARLLLLPLRFRTLYHFPQPESWAEPVWFFSLAGAVILAAAVAAAKKNRRLFPLLLCLAVSLLPSLYRLGSAGRVVAEQRLYFPSFFFCLAAAVAIDGLRISSGGRPSPAGCLGWLACIPLVVLTAGYLRTWRDEISLWRRVTGAEPRAAIAVNNLAIALFRTGDEEAARREWERARELDPDLAEAHTNLGILAGRENLWEEAAAHFRDALAAEHSHHPAAVYLAQARRKMGRYRAAAEILRGVLEDNPAHAQAAHELAVVLERMGEVEEAEELYRKAAGLNPEYSAPLRGLAALHSRNGEFDLAVRAARAAIAREPGRPRGYIALANIHIARGRLEEAREVLREGELSCPDDWGLKSRRLAIDSLAPE